MKYFVLEGVLNVEKKIARGSSASIYTAKLRRKSKTRGLILKRIPKRLNTIWGLYRWKDAGMLVPPNKTKAPLKLEFVDVTASKKSVCKNCCFTELYEAYSAWDNDNAKFLRLGTTYATESKIARILSRHVSPKLPKPVFCKIRSSFTTTFHHNIVMDDAGYELETNTDLLTLEELQSIVVQVIVALAHAQQQVYFKHHDMHTGNVYFRVSKTNRVWKFPDGSTVDIPSDDVEAVIADFGLSVANVNETRIGRLDYPLLNTDEKGWGEWDYNLKGNEGYDLLVLIDALRDVCGKEHKSWIKSVINDIRKLVPKLRISKRGRPLCAVPITPKEFLAMPSFQFANLKVI